jgi:hypothetical protein
MVARKQGIPFLLTFHGTYLDSLNMYKNDVDFIITVSDAIRDHLSKSVSFPVDRIITIPNGVETSLFHRTNSNWDEVVQLYPVLADKSFSNEDRRILFVSRFDKDKKFIVDMVKETWKKVKETKAFDIVWLVVGNGTLRTDLEASASEINFLAGREIIIFMGWQNEESLARLYNACHLTVGPGRCVIESMACGTPAVAVGSKGYVGLIDKSSFTKGVYENFGGFGSKHDFHRADAMFSDIDRVIYDDHTLYSLGHLSEQTVKTFFRQKDLDDRLLRLYHLCCAFPPQKLCEENIWVDLSYPALSFSDINDSNSLSRAWAFPRNNKQFDLSISEDGYLMVDCEMLENDKFYLVNDSAGFSAPPLDVLRLKIESNGYYEVSLNANISSKTLNVQLWIIEYGNDERIAHSKIVLKEGMNKIEMRSSPRTSCFKAALRFSGRGRVKLSPIRIRQYKSIQNPSGVTPKSIKRIFHLRNFHDFQGENLVFIFGPPRSGTTWVLKLLQEHPDVIAATEENLNAKINILPTLETNIFNDNRPFTNNQIKNKFYRLAQRHPGKAIVEKTPVHLFFVDRIRRIFPKAAVVLTERDGRDIVTSIVNVGRDSDAWWKGAPDTVDGATRLWKRYAKEALLCMESHYPFVIRYERLIENTLDELSNLIIALGLSLHHVKKQIDACRDGKNISIRGVFREGKSGNWKRQLSKSDVKTFKEIAGDILLRLGYEEDDFFDLS